MKTKTEVRTFPTLYSKAKGGAIIQWDVSVVGDTITTVHGLVGGKMQTFSKRVEAKNVGRSNATTVEEQAVREAQAMWQHRIDRRYSQTPEEAQMPLFLPMLAHNWEQHKTGMIYPVFMQPKLDGFRCLATKEDGVVTMYSRSGDTFALPHIAAELSCLPDESVLDGELYCHGVPFQKVASWIKKQHPETAHIGYHVYDVPEMKNHVGLAMTDRAKILDALKQYQWANISIVDTASVNSTDEVYAYQLKCIKQGYEGAIVRTPGGKYSYGYRSQSLLKVKTFDDMEATILSGKPGVGKFVDMCVFECVTKDGAKFNVMPVGTAEARREYLTNLKCYIGKQLTVKYFGKSEDGVPRFPVGLGIREKFDMDKKGKRK